MLEAYTVGHTGTDALKVIHIEKRKAMADKITKILLTSLEFLLEHKHHYPSLLCSRA